MKKISRDLIPFRDQVATDVWNAWRRRRVGGFTSADVRSVGTSDAVTVLQASTHPSMRRRRGIRSSPALSRVRTGSSITRSRG